MFYSIRHVTRFHYSSPVSESVMEVRMRPRSEFLQQCLKFELHVTPRARVLFYRDYLGNTVHHFDVPGHHNRLALIAEAVVEVEEPAELPASLPLSAWAAIDEMGASGELYEFQTPSHFTEPSAELEKFIAELGVDRSQDPLTLLRALNQKICAAFEYVPKSTRVDSPIALALANRKGVCQDFTHIMISGMRSLGLPVAYVSGYLRTVQSPDEKRLEGADAMHAWALAWCGEEAGWIGLDPTNDILASHDHVVLAIGRDYADVAPVDGVIFASGAQRLETSVHVVPVG